MEVVAADENPSQENLSNSITYLWEKPASEDYFV